MRIGTSFAFLAVCSLAAQGCGGSSKTQNNPDAAMHPGPDASVGDLSQVTPTDGSGNPDGTMMADAAMAFTPASLSAVALWLDGDTVTTSGTAVTAWPDQTSHHNDASQGTTANQPMLTASGSGINGHAVVTFDGTASFLTIADATSLQLSANGFTIEAVVRFPAATSGDFGQSIYDKAMSSGEGPELEIVHTTQTGHGAEALGQLDGSGMSTVNSAFDVAAATAHRLSLSYIPGPVNTSGTLSLSVDGGTAVTKNITGLPATIAATGVPVSIGRSSSTSAIAQFFHGDIASILVVNGALASSDQQQIDAYLKNRFGVQ